VRRAGGGEASVQITWFFSCGPTNRGEGGLLALPPTQGHPVRPRGAGHANEGSLPAVWACSGAALPCSGRNYHTGRSSVGWAPGRGTLTVAVPRILSQSRLIEGNFAVAGPLAGAGSYCQSAGTTQRGNGVLGRSSWLGWFLTDYAAIGDLADAGWGRRFLRAVNPRCNAAGAFFFFFQQKRPGRGFP